MPSVGLRREKSQKESQLRSILFPLSRNRNPQTSNVLFNYLLESPKHVRQLRRAPLTSVATCVSPVLCRSAKVVPMTDRPILGAKVPPNLPPSRQLRVVAPDGREVLVVVPLGMQAGDTIEVQVPQTFNVCMKVSDTRARIIAEQGLVQPWQGGTSSVTGEPLHPFAGQHSVSEATDQHHEAQLRAAPSLSSQDQRPQAPAPPHGPLSSWHHWSTDASQPPPPPR